MTTPPPEVLAAARLITKRAAENNLGEFTIDGVQQRVFKPRRARSTDEWCTSYHCAGDCGRRGHGYQHAR